MKKAKAWCNGDVWRTEDKVSAAMDKLRRLRERNDRRGMRKLAKQVSDAILALAAMD